MLSFGANFVRCTPAARDCIATLAMTAPMDFDRRQFLKLSAAASVAVTAGVATPAAAGPISALGIDATHHGVRPGSPDDQSLALQRAIDAATAARAPLALPPGNYRAGDLKLGPGTQIIGVRGATRIIFGQGRELMNAAGVTGMDSDFGGALRSAAGAAFCVKESVANTDKVTVTYAQF